MDIELLGPLNGLAVAGVAYPFDDGHDHGRVHGVGNHESLSYLAGVGPFFGRALGTLLVGHQ